MVKRFIVDQEVGGRTPIRKGRRHSEKELSAFTSDAKTKENVQRGPKRRLV